MMKLFLLLLAAWPLAADGPGLILSKYIGKDFALAADPEAAAWKSAGAIFAENGPKGDPTPGHRTEIRSRWSSKNLYFLFICPYEALNLKPNPTTKEETNKLWDWDVAEVFIGTNFENIRRYKEFQVSPQSEWVDLDIDRDHPLPEGGWRWNSGYEVKAQINSEKKIWYGEMRIPIAKIDDRRPEAGREMRINFYRLQGPGPQRKGIAWQPTNAPSYHVPEAFGRLKLVK
jgi:Carbohydrate family 9 binding domain-like